MGHKYPLHTWVLLDDFVDTQCVYFFFFEKLRWWQSYCQLIWQNCRKWYRISLSALKILNMIEMFIKIFHRHTSLHKCRYIHDKGNPCKSAGWVSLVCTIRILVNLKYIAFISFSNLHMDKTWMPLAYFFHCRERKEEKSIRIPFRKFEIN